MQRLIRIFKGLQRGSAITAAVLYTLSPVLAGAQQAVNTDRTFEDLSRNGLPVYNINKPNNRGVSNNIHNNFNIPTGGAIDNNSAVISYSQLEQGYIEGNPNLQAGKEASTIVHQVIGGTRSQMDGLLEVAGKKAQLVVVNESGITCNGCGFINTSRATLSTGALSINADGDLAGFDITRGDILLTGTGLDAVSGNQASGQVDLLARTIAIRDAAKLRAQTLNVIAGANRVDYDGLAHEKITGAGGVPEVALDVAALGGMYADHISLIATDDGVGVNMNGAAASASNLTLDASGRVSFGIAANVSSGGQTTVSTGLDFENAGRVKSAGDLAISARNIGNSGELNSGGAIALQADTTISIDKTALIRAEENAAFVAGQNVKNSGVVAAYGNLDIDAPDIRNDGGILWARENIALGYGAGVDGKADYVLNRNGRIEAFDGDLTIKATEIVNQGTAPTANIKENIFQFYETPGPVDPNGDIRNRLVAAAFYDESGDIRPEYLGDYVALWEELFSGDLENSTVLPAKFLTLLKETAIAGGGNTLDASWVTYFGRLYGKASEAGVSSIVEFMRDLMVEDARVAPPPENDTPEDGEDIGGAADPEFPPVVDGPVVDVGSIKDEYLTQYLALWEALSSGQELGAEALAAVNPVYVRDGKILPEIANLWKAIRAGSGENYTILVTITQDTLNDDGVLAELKSGRNIRLEATNINNIYGAIQAGNDLSITAENLTNTAFGASQTRHEVHKRGCFTCHEGVLDFSETFGGVIEGHGNLDISIANSLNNLTIGSRSAAQLLADIGVRLQSTSNRLVAETPKPRTSTVAPTPTVSTPGAATSTLENLQTELAEILEVLHENFEEPDSGELDAFMSSPYLLGRLDFEPLIAQNDLRPFEVLSADNPTVRQQWATQQIRTAQLLGASATDARQGLISDQLELALALPTVLPNGTKPLSSVTAFLDQRNGALIAGNDIDIDAGTIRQIGGGEISGQGDVVLAADSIDLERGEINAGTDLSIEGKNGVRLAAVDVTTGNDLSITSQDGDVSIETIEERTEFTRVLYADVAQRKAGCSNDADGCGELVVKRVQTGSGKGTAVAHQGGSFNIGGDLTIEAAKDVAIIGTDIDAGGNAKIAASGDLLIGSARNVHDYSGQGRKSSSVAHSEDLTTSTISAKGDVALTGTNVTLEASGVAADGKLDVLAFNDLSIVAGVEKSSYSYKSSSGGGGFFGKKKTESLNESHLTYESSALSSGDDLSLNAMGNILIAGSEVQSGENINITAFGGLTVTSLQEQHHREHKVEKKGPFGGLFGGSSSRTEIRDLTEIKGAEVASLADLTTQSGSDTTIRASRVSAGGDLNISVGKGPFADPDAKLWLLTDKERDYLSVSEYEGGFLKWTMTEYGHEKEVVRHAILESGGDFVIESPGGVVVEYRSTGDFAADIAQLSQAPGLEYLADLQGMDNVDWQGVEEIYKTWYDQSSGLGGGAMALIAIATAILTAGATAGLAAAMTGATAGGAGAASVTIAGVTYAGSVAQITAMTMINAALAGVATTVTTSVANGAVSGDMRGAFQSIFSSNTLRNIVVGALTAGAAQSINLDTFGFEDLGKSPEFVTTLLNEGIDGVIRSGISSTITGDDFGDSLIGNLRLAAASTIGASLAAEIGKEYNEAIVSAGGELDGGTWLWHKVAHAALGCARGEIAQSGGCAAGAAGGVGGAVSSELYQWMTEESTLQKIQGLAELEPGQEPTAEQQEMFERWRQDGVDVGRLVGAASAALIATSGNEVYIGADAGQSAAQDNVLPAVILLVKGAMVAWTLYELYDNATTAYELVDKFVNGELTEAELQDALINAGIDAVIDVSLGKLKILEKAYTLAKKAGLTDKADNLYRKLVREEVQQAGGSGMLGLPAPDYKVPDGYKMVRNADGSATVTGPSGGIYNSTGFYNSDGKPVYKSETGGYFTLDGGRLQASAPTDYTAVPIHHICTNKCTVGVGEKPAWTNTFEEYFKNAGLEIDSEINKIAVPGHRGPHPQEYHQYIFQEIEAVTRGVPVNTDEYKNAMESVLNRLKVEAVTPGSQVNRWLTGQG